MAITQSCCAISSSKPPHPSTPPKQQARFEQQGPCFCPNLGSSKTCIYCHGSRTKQNSDTCSKAEWTDLLLDLHAPCRAQCVWLLLTMKQLEKPCLLFLPVRDAGSMSKTWAVTGCMLQLWHLGWAHNLWLSAFFFGLLNNDNMVTFLKTWRI